MHWLTSPGEKYFGGSCIGSEVDKVASILQNVDDIGMSLCAWKTLTR